MYWKRCLLMPMQFQTGSDSWKYKNKRDCWVSYIGDIKLRILSLKSNPKHKVLIKMSQLTFQNHPETWSELELIQCWWQYQMVDFSRLSILLTIWTALNWCVGILFWICVIMSSFGIGSGDCAFDSCNGDVGSRF